MKAPQIIMVILMSINLGIELINHGKTAPRTYNVVRELVADGLLIALLWWGGFWN